MTPKPVNKRGCAVLDILTAGLDHIEDHRKIDNNGEDSGIMAVHVECIGEIEGMGLLYSVAHYYKQCGDLMRDPEMTFIKMRDGKYYQESVEFGHSNCQVRPKMQKDHAVFAGTWMQNIKQQQRLHAGRMVK